MQNDDPMNGGAGAPTGDTSGQPAPTPGWQDPAAGQPAAPTEPTSTPMPEPTPSEPGMGGGMPAAEPEAPAEQPAA